MNGEPISLIEFMKKKQIATNLFFSKMEQLQKCQLQDDKVNGNFTYNRICTNSKDFPHSTLLI